MLENILLSAAYYESFSKFASALKPNKMLNTSEMASIAADTLEDFYVSAADTGASEDEIKALGEELFLHVLAELDTKADENDADVKDLEREIFQGLMDQVDL